MAFTPSSITTQIMKYLPRLTNLFCDNTSIVGTVSGSAPQLLTVTLANHGYTNGQFVILSNSLINNPIIGVAQYTDTLGNNVLRFQTQAPHDLICNKTLVVPDIDSVTLLGFTDTGLNSIFVLTDVSDRTHFDIIYPTLPTLNGSELLQMYISTGLDGIWAINFIDVNTFSITLTGAMFIQPGLIPRLNISWHFRISSVYDWTRAQELYTKQTSANKAWMFIIMGDCRASKDVNIQSDAKQTNTQGNEQKIKMINTFSLNVIIPTTGSFTAGEAMELCWGNLLFWLIQVASGVNFPTTVNSPYITSLIDHGPTVYNTAYYGHSFTFEYNYEVANIETFNNNFNESVAFRNINFSLIAPLDSGSSINLDTMV